MKTKIFYFFVFIFITLQLIAQTAPDTLWTRVYDSHFDDSALSIKQTFDGGFIAYGYTGNGSMLLKVDNNGLEEWRTNHSYQGQDVIQNIDGDYILTGQTRPEGIDYDYYLMKIDQQGNEVWMYTYGGTNDDYSNCVQQTYNGGYSLFGRTNSFGLDSYCFGLVKTDENGIEEWNQTYSNSHFGFSMIQTTDNGYILAGSMENLNAPNNDLLLIKTDEFGNEIWRTSMGGDSWDCAFSVIQVADGGYVTVGGSESYGNGNGDIWLIKTDENGNIEWDNSFGIDNNFECGREVHQIDSNGFIIAGYRADYSNGDDGYLVKTDELGNLIWEKLLGGEEDDWIYSIQQTYDGGYLAAGYTESFGAIDRDFWLVRLGSETGIYDTNISINQNYLSNHPNPFNPSTTIEFSIKNDSKIELTIFNIKGQKIKTLANDKFIKGSHSITWIGDDEAGKDISSGIYYYKLKINGRTEAVKKCLLLK